MTNPPDTPPKRHIIRLLGGDLETARQNGATAEKDIAREGDGVAMTTIEAGYDQEYYTKFLNTLREAICNHEQPVFYVNAHGANNTTDGRHCLILHAADAVFDDVSKEPDVTESAAESKGNPDYATDTNVLLGKMVADYQREYKAVNGVSAVPPRVLVTLAACSSEGAVHDLSPALTKQADFLIADSEQRNTYQDDSAYILPALANSSSAEVAFIRQLTTSIPASSYYAIPELATQRGVADGDALRDRVGKKNFQQAMTAAHANLNKLPAEVRNEAKQALATLKPANIEAEGNERQRALLGYVANYDTRYTSYATYRAQGQLLKEYYSNEDRPLKENVALLMRMDANHRDMVVGTNGLRIPRGYLQNPNLTNAEGQTALMAASASANTRGVDMLLALGANPNIADKSGDTALFYAMRNGSIAIAETLIKNGADKNHRNSDGNTALHATIATETEYDVQGLLDQGVDINATNNGGYSALHLAASWNKTTAIETLLEAGARTDVRNSEGGTPLLQAAFFADTAGVQLFIDHEADVNVTDNLGATPLLAAMAKGDKETIELLLSAGAKPGAADIDKDGQLSDVEAQFFYLKKFLPDAIPKDVDSAFDTNGDGTATVEEVALQLAKHGVRFDAMLSSETTLGSMNRVAEELRGTTPDKDAIKR